MAALGPPCAASADEIAYAAISRYEQEVPARKRPRPGEWTMMAAFLLVRDRASSPPPGTVGPCQVVSFATGTKCVGGQSKAPRGCAVLDSHAEVLARRGLRRWLAAEAGTALSGTTASAFVERSPSGGRAVRLRPCWSLHLFASFPPCGDAAVLVGGGGALLRTGAHAVGSEGRPFARGHETGSLRTKPGRGSASCSMSCSDKIVRWCALGVQGAALSALFPEPLRPASIVISAPPPALLASQPGAAPSLALASESEVGEAVRQAALRALRRRVQQALWSAFHPDPGAAAPAVRVTHAQFPHAEQFAQRAAEPVHARFAPPADAIASSHAPAPNTFSPLAHRRQRGRSGAGRTAPKRRRPMYLRSTWQGPGASASSAATASSRAGPWASPGSGDGLGRGRRAAGAGKALLRPRRRGSGERRPR